MKWMLDTDTCIATIKKHPTALRKLRGKSIGQVGISSVTPDHETSDLRKQMCRLTPLEPEHQLGYQGCLEAGQCKDLIPCAVPDRHPEPCTSSILRVGKIVPNGRIIFAEQSRFVVTSTPPRHITSDATIR